MEISVMVEDNNQYRVLPENTLDYNMMMIESVWGKESITEELKKKLLKIKSIYVDEQGEPIKDADGNIKVANSENLWSTLGFYTRDLRLGNLDASQFKYAVHYLDLAGDFLRIEMLESFLVCLSRVATILELGQSKGGFLRNRQNTLTTEQKVSGLNDPGKRSFFTGKEIMQK